MAKRKGNTKKGASNPTSGPQDSITIRQEITGKFKPKVSNNVKTYLNHLENLATWASGKASIPSLAAFFGQRLATAAESLAVAPDASLFTCQRCETILQPGSNCSIRIEKNNAKRRRRQKKCCNSTQNNVAYYCHHCSCRNIKRGTPKGHMKVLYDAAFERRVKPVDVKDGKECETSAVERPTEILTIDAPKIPDASAIPPPTGDITALDNPAIQLPKTEGILNINSPATPSAVSITTLSKPQKWKMTTTLSEKHIGHETRTDREKKTGAVPTVDTPATPSTSTGVTLLDSKKRKRNKPSSKNQTEPGSCSAPTADGDRSEGTSKRNRKRKSWTSLKEVARTNEQSGKQKNMAELAIPFSLY
ncbi:hypothetical protein SDJN02_22821, partial [Cucurbita argyrosperma subsp. argyrosperma]